MVSVFIADDHAIVRDGLRMLLEAQDDIEVVGMASDGLQAVKSIESLKPDVVLMDISMPKLNGIEAAQQIAKACRNTRIIFLSMHDGSEYISRAVKAGAQGYLLKESAGQEVIKAVRQVHSGIRYFSQRVSNDLIDFYAKDNPAKNNHPSLDQLSFRERETLQLVVEGKSSAEIAEILYLSPKTIETYRSRIMEKLNIHDIPGLVKFAIKKGMTTIDC
ncbi:MAG: response regulator transcription factor [Proteobacteria bacterium]|nr:response regulator transcription factor [Pseudomonadota bacterium]MBU4468967.1 response regulator transcription factor [Pseudomonadota bacterium]MCG2752103.1 response regulator transcription factor [Desulfobacteraceae bacterium]